MRFTTNRFGGNDTARNETLFTTGNGNLGFRGDTEEKNGTCHKGTYINGFYDSEPIQYGETAYGYAKNHETILNLPDPKRIELFVDGHAFDLCGSDGSSVTDFSLELDQKKESSPGARTGLAAKALFLWSARGLFLSAMKIVPSSATA